jgi:hypothetical protein
MEHIMNEYEEIYKFKNNPSVDSKEEVSSLNNNFSIEENQKDLEYFNLFQDSTNSKSIDFDTNSERVFDQNMNSDELEATPSTQLEFGSTKQDTSNCICARCQNDIRKQGESYAQFWLKDNKLTMCINDEQCATSQCADGASDSGCQPFELDFKLPESPLDGAFKVTSLEDELKSMEDFVKSLTAGDDIENDIEANTESAFPEVRGNHTSSSDQIGDIIVEPEQFITQPNVSCGEQNNATIYCWSQSQADQALEGNVDSSSTNSKGTSDKKFNALSIRRSCFRSLSAFYKGTFSKFNRAWQAKRRNKKKTRDMNELIDTYMRQEFKELLNELGEDFLVSLRNALIAVLHSHRYKKQEEFTDEIDFSVIRDVLYSYTLDARDRFINDPAYALIFHHFFARGGTEFTNSRVQNKSNIYAFELTSLNKDALNTLK